ncbi:MAG: SDR family NAD(P)-dependent oxidoreductase [Tepidisphaeraceae bacterium]
MRKLAVVTGASGGIGYAIALALATAGFHAVLVARRAGLLDELAERIRSTGGSAEVCAVDLLAEKAAETIASLIDGRAVDVLVHCAAAFAQAPFAEADTRDFDRLFQLNVRSPLMLTQRLLPNVIDSLGMVVFINSSVGLRAGRDMVIYGATKHALRAVADTLRLEVNQHGVRVLSLYCGRVATPMQEQLFAAERRPYQPELLTQPSDIAEALLGVLALPRTTETTDIHVRPAKASY